MFWQRQRAPRPPRKRISTGRPLSVWERYLERGLAEMEKGNYSDALDDIDAAVDETPSPVGELFATRGLILYHLNRRQEAEAALEEGFRLDKHQWLVFYVRGLFAMKDQNFEAAVEQLTRAVEYVPTRPEILYSRAMAFYGQGHLDATIADLKFAIEHNDSKDKTIKEVRNLLKKVEAENK